MERLLTILVGGLIGFLFAEAVVTIVQVIRDRITARNLGRYSKEALATNEKTRDLIAETIQFELTKRNGNTLSLDALRNGKKVAQIQLQTESVADDVYEGMTVAA